MNCNKRSYESEGIALVIIDELISDKIEGSKSLSPYQCEDCEMWHLTSRNNEY